MELIFPLIFIYIYILMGSYASNSPSLNPLTMVPTSLTREMISGTFVEPDVVYWHTMGINPAEGIVPG